MLVVCVPAVIELDTADFNAIAGLGTNPAPAPGADPPQIGLPGDGGDVTFAGNVRLTNVPVAPNVPGDASTATTIDTVRGADPVNFQFAGAAGDVTFQGTVDGDDQLIITSGFTDPSQQNSAGGDVLFQGVVGGAEALGLVTINSAETITADAAFTANGLNWTADAETGDITTNGLVTSLNALPAGGPNSVVFNASNMDINSSLLAQGQLVDLNITGVNAGDGLVVTKDAAAGITFGISTSGVAAQVVTLLVATSTLIPPALFSSTMLQA